MRIASLDLLAFGPFTRTRLSFGTEAGKLSLVYGPNEAGKSTLLRALSALLFQIPSRTVDAHVHEMGKLRLGGTLIGADGRTLSIVRRKGVKQTLFDRQERTLDESVLTTLLGGVNESLFRQVFALDHERLREGAELLLEGKGDVGESLFEAGLNARSLHKAQLALRAEADEIYKPRGQTPKLNACLRALRENERRRKDAMLSPQIFESERQALREAEAAQQITLDKRRALVLERERLERSLRTLPLLVQLARTEQGLAELGEVAHVSESDLARFERIVTELAEARTEAQRAAAQLAGLDGELASVAKVPEHVLEEDELSDLGERFGSYRAALRELPQRRAERDSLVRETSSLRTQLGLGDAQHGLIDTPLRAKLLGLIEAERVAVEELARAELVDHLARAELAALQTKRAAFAPWRSGKGLSLVCSEAQAEGSSALLAALATGIAQRTAQLARRVRDLAFEREPERDALLRLAVPTREQVAQLAHDYGEANVRHADLVRELKRTEGELRELQRSLARSEALGALLGEEQLAHARAERDRLWHGLGDAIQRGSAVESAQIRELDLALHQSDALSDRLRHESTQAAELALLDVRRRELELECRALSEAREGVRAQVLAIESGAAALCQRLGLKLRAPDALERAYEPLIALIEECRALVLAQTEYDARRTREQELVARLRRILCELESPTPDEMNAADLLAHALDQLVAIERETGEHERLSREQQASEARARESTTSKQALCAGLEHTRGQLSQAALGLGFARSASGVEVRALVDGLGELDVRLAQLQVLQARVANLEADVGAFEHDVQVAAQRVGVCAQATPEELLRVLRESQREARDARRDNERLLTQKRRLQAERDRFEQVANARLQALSELLLVVNAADEAAFRALSSRARTRTEVLQERARLENELLVQSDGLSAAVLREQVEGLDVDQARARLVEIGEASDELEDELRQREQHIGRSRAGVELLEHTTGARELSEDVEADLSSARALVRRYVEVRLAAQLLAREVERYRAEHQGPVLTRASQLFPRLTLERYRSLDVDYGDDARPVLCAVRHDGVRVHVAGLSDGTRDQLYLALRIASIERFLEHSPAPPLVLDDAFVHFDDERTRAALEVLTELAQRTQVLYFTHHARVVELARATLDETRLQVQTLASASGTRLIVRDDGPLFSR